MPKDLSRKKKSYSVAYPGFGQAMSIREEAEAQRIARTEEKRIAKAKKIKDREGKTKEELNVFNQMAKKRKEVDRIKAEKDESERIREEGVIESAKAEKEAEKIRIAGMTSEEKSKAEMAAYKKELTGSDGSAFENISAAYKMGGSKTGKLALGAVGVLTELLKGVSTPTGMNILAGLEKDPVKAGAYASTAKGMKASHAALKAARMKARGELLKTEQEQISREKIAKEVRLMNLQDRVRDAALTTKQAQAQLDKQEKLRLQKREDKHVEKLHGVLFKVGQSNPAILEDFRKRGATNSEDFKFINSKGLKIKAPIVGTIGFEDEMKVEYSDKYRKRQFKSRGRVYTK